MSTFVLVHGAWQSRRTVAEDYPARPFFQPFAEKARVSGWDMVAVESGHDCHVERSGNVAKLLLSTTLR